MELLFLFAVVAIFAVFGRVGQWVGSTRGRPDAGAVLGYCLGPLGWLLAMFLPAPFVPPKSGEALTVATLAAIEREERRCAERDREETLR